MAANDFEFDVWASLKRPPCKLLLCGPVNPVWVQPWLYVLVTGHGDELELPPANDLGQSRRGDLGYCAVNDRSVFVENNRVTRVGAFSVGCDQLSQSYAELLAR